MKYIYENLSWEQFEELAIAISQKLLGVSVQGFSKGPDGGRDAKFVGVAEQFPSAASPWTGTTIIQAKHTNASNKSFSEPDFFSKRNRNPNCIIAKELPRIASLRTGGNLDNYLLFSNRRLTGQTETDIRSNIADKTGLPIESIHLCGIEQIERYLKIFPEAASLANIDPIDSPLIVGPEELSEIVQALAQHSQDIRAAFTKPVPRISYETKNKTNNMTDAYAKVLLRRYLKDTDQIAAFLADPNNIESLEMYQTTIDEFQLKITAKRKDHQTFDGVMEHLADILFGRDAVLRANKVLTRAVLFYMYWNCDIGASDDAASK